MKNKKTKSHKSENRNIRKDIIPLSIQNAIVLQELDIEKEEIKKYQEIANKMHEVRQKCLQEINEMIGNEAYENYRQLYEAENEKIKETFHYPDGPKMNDDEIQALYKKRVDIIHKYFLNNGINIDEIKNVVIKFRKEFKEYFDKVQALREHQNTIMEAIEEVEEEPSPEWTVIEPPFEFPDPNVYLGSRISENNYVNSDNICDIVENSVANENSGMIGQFHSFRTTKGAGDFSPALSVNKAEFKFLYQVPKSGKIQILGLVKNHYNRYQAMVADEFGISGSDIWQINQFIVRILDGSREVYEYQNISSLRKENYDNGHWDVSYINPKYTFYVPLLSALTYTKDQWVVIQMGSRIIHSIILNDVQYSGALNFTWRFEKIQIRMVE